MEDSHSISSTGYKGKVLRSWAQLPPEVIRLIATFYLYDVTAYAYCPTTWEARDMWPRRMVYTVMREVPEVEKLMQICPSWGMALEQHPFWQQACAALDPNDVFAQHRYIQIAAPAAAGAGGSNAAPTVVRVSHQRHFRNLYRCTCIVCRINNPFQNTGLAAAKRFSHTAWLGVIPVCKDHRKASFCGLCLREAPALEVETEYSYVGCVENDDEETFPGIDATCRSCRMETLWRIAGRRRGDREALGGPSLESPDWETRQAVESFIEMGDGTISDVLNTAREKFWMRQNTKLADMLMQALAANRYATRAEAGETGYGSDDDMSDEEDDFELLSLTEDSGGVKDLAMLDWARSRILDGYWINPADHYYNLLQPGKEFVATEHPCPWNKGAVFTGALDDGEVDEELQHPRPKTIAVSQPPTFNLSDHGLKAYARAMRDILLPAMKNLVRRIVIECTADGVDPAVKASKMSLEEVVRELRDEAMWFNGIDWLERRANCAKEDRETTRNERRRASEEDDCSSSSRSDGSHTTSPVLSTTTLQTTPSPPPSSDAASKEDEPSASSPTTAPAPAVPIPVAPVLKSPTLIHPIPYIPVTISHLPQYSRETVWIVWREAMSPLFQCRCSICERAMLKLNIANGNIVPSQAANNPLQPSPDILPSSQTPIPPQQKSVEVQLEEAISRGDLTVLDEFKHDAESPAKQYRRAQTPGPDPRRHPLAEEDEEDEDDSIIDFDKSESEGETKEPNTRSNKSLPVTPRKRSSRELDDVDVERESNVRAERAGSPPKRARVDGSYSPARVATPPSSPSKLRKRSSEELDDDDAGSPTGNGDAKRRKPSADRLDAIRAVSAGVARARN